MRGALVIVIAVAACGGAAGDDDAIGPDAADDAVDAPPGDDVAEVPPACVAERGTSDRPDDSALDQIRVLYVIPSDGVDRARDTSGEICNSVRAFATWFHRRAEPLYLRFDTNGGELDIGFVRLPLTDEQMRGNDPNNTSIDTGTAFVRERIERELVRMGVIAANKLYAVYYDGDSRWACGGGAYPPLIVGRVGAMYLRAIPLGLSVPCADTRPWGQASLLPDYIDYGMLHETVHSLGFVPDAAPHEHSSGHVFDDGAPDPSRDLMYSPRMGRPDPPWGIDAGDGLLIDIGNDDYFQPTSGLDMAHSSLLAPLPAGAVRPYGW